MMQATMEDAYREACTALGEAIVRERLVTQHAAALQLENERLAAMTEPLVEATSDGTADGTVPPVSEH